MQVSRQGPTICDNRYPPSLVYRRHALSSRRVRDCHRDALRLQVPYVRLVQEELDLRVPESAPPGAAPRLPAALGASRPAAAGRRHRSAVLLPAASVVRTASSPAVYTRGL